MYDMVSRFLYEIGGRLMDSYELAYETTDGSIFENS